MLNRFNLRCRTIFATYSVLLAGLTATAVGEDWPQYRGPIGTGVSTEALPEWSGSAPRQVWKTDTPLGFSSFSVAGGRAYTMVVEDERETCLALDAKSGKKLWSVAFGSPDYKHGGGNAGANGNRGGDGPRSTPASDGERVYVYDSHLLLTCLSAKDGKIIWQHDIVKEFSGRNIKWLNATSPLLDGDRLYVIGGGAGESFLAFDKSNGEVIWKNGDETMTHATPTIATINGKKQLIFFVKAGLAAVDIEDGAELWFTDFKFAVSTAASPVVEKDHVYCSAGYGVGAGLFQIEGNDAKEVWIKPNRLMNHWSTPIVHNGHLYGIFGFKKYGDAPLQCVELATGDIKWEKSGFGPGNCILVGEKLVILSDDGHVVVANASPSGYDEVGRAKVVDGKCWSTPAYSDGHIFVRSTKEGAAIQL